MVISVAGVLAAAGAAFGATAGASSGRPIAASRPARPVASESAGVDAPVVPGPSSGAASAICPTESTPVSPQTPQSPVGSATHLFTRTTGDGVTMRAYRLTGGRIVGCGPVPVDGGPLTSDLVCAASTVSVELSDDSAVGQGDLGTPLTALASGTASPTTTTTTAQSAAGSQSAADPEPQAVASGAFGVVEGDPVWWVSVQVGGEVADAQVTFADGSTDAMAPVDGVAVLAHHIGASTVQADPYDVTGTLVLTDSSGDVLATVTLPDDAEPTPVPLPLPTPPTGTIPPAPASGSGSGTGGSGLATGTSPPVSNGGAPSVSLAPDPGGAIACPMVPIPGEGSSSAPSS